MTLSSFGRCVAGSALAAFLAAATTPLAAQQTSALQSSAISASARFALMPLRLWRMLRVSDHVNGRLVSSYLLLAFTRTSAAP